MDAAKRKIAVELDPVIVCSRARRPDLYDDERVWDLERAQIGRGRADDERVGLERGARAHSHNHAIRENAALQVGASNAFPESNLRSKLDQGMGGGLGRHHDGPAVAQLRRSLPVLEAMMGLHVSPRHAA
jgi:hypothetical protein